MTDEVRRIERTLWCLHTIGPDDVNAAPDFETAVRWAAYHNAQTEKYTVERGMQNDPHWPFVRSVVAIWPGTAEAHAADLPKSIAACSPPTPEPAQPAESPEARAKIEALFEQAFNDGIEAEKSGDDQILAGASSAYAQSAMLAFAASTARPTEQAVMVCPQCDGEGGYPDGIDETSCHTECARCGGNGWIVDLKAFMPPATENNEREELARVLRWFGLDQHADNIAAGESVPIPSYVALSLIAARPTERGAVEVLAWHYSRPNSVYPKLPHNVVVVTASSRWANPDGWTETPLYAALAQPATDQAAEVDQYALGRLAEMVDFGRIDAAYGSFSHPAVTMIADVRKMLPALRALDTQPATGRTMGGEDGLREALDWALSEIEGRTRYDNSDQRQNCIDIANDVLAASKKDSGR